MTTVERGFPEFFQAITGQEPFEWQDALTNDLRAGRFPDVIDVPTGFGKTAVVLCWAYALAHADPADRLPRRLYLVVDRRIIVDAAHELAERLRTALSDPAASVAIRDVGTRLVALSASPDEPLAVRRMRGGLTWDSVWLSRPDLPAVVAGTVDQFGSRLLFRGYGVSPKMRPVDAALVGTDAWLVIDEAHIAEPLRRSATSVSNYQAIVDPPVASPLRVTAMSATAQHTGRIFRADPEVQRASTRFPASAQAAQRRLSAAKPTYLVEIDDLATSTPKRRRQASEQLGVALADIARRVTQAGVIGVMTNTVAAARAAHDRLAATGERTSLLTGRCREFERDAVWTGVKAFALVGAPALPDGDRRFVVATQTLEVGADVDFDALVTECAPLPSLAQRLGRLNRIGRRSSTTGVIVWASGLHRDDVIYGSANEATWKSLLEGGSAVIHQTRASAAGIELGDNPLDLGLPNLRALMDSAPATVRSEAPVTPQLTGAHIERWAATQPAPMPDQDVAPFLHGVERAVPEVSVAWRTAPANGSDPVKAWTDWLAVVRPVDWEYVDVPIWELRALLADTDPPSALSDLETGQPVDLDLVDNATTNDRVLGVVYRGPTEKLTPITGPRDVRPGDRAVLSAHVGGHNQWGWTGRRAGPDEPPVPDVGDLAPWRADVPLRLDANAAVITSLIADADTAAKVRQIVQGAFAAVLDTEGDWEPLVDECLARLRELELPTPLDDRVRELVGRRRRVVALGGSDESSPQAIVVTADPSWVAVSLDVVSDDDEGSTSAGPPQSLAEHGAEVGRRAGEVAAALGVPTQIAQAVELAARWHDLGKADKRFQRWLYDGNPFATALEPRAKSGRDWRDPLIRVARQASGLPPGFRHEAVSGRLVHGLIERCPGMVAGLDTELLHHLVVSHHGHARPLMQPLLDATADTTSVTIDEETVEVPAARLQVDWQHPSRFERLNARYGWWGLALLEAIVRLADVECSSKRTQVVVP